MAKRKAGKYRKRRANRKQGVRWGRRLILWFCFWLVLAAALALLVLDGVVRSKFEGAKWSLPAHVYGRALDLYEGQSLARSELRWELEQLGYRAVQRVTGPGQYRLSGSGLELHTRPFRFWDGDEPARHLTLRFHDGRITDLEHSGSAGAMVRLEPLQIGGIYPEHSEDRILVTLEEVPPYLVEGLLAVEDQNFYEHHGISFRGIVRAMVANLRAGDTVQGGSTLTQQLVKNLYLSQERSLLRKGVEAVMAVMLELHYDKDQILEAYLNEVFLGQSGKRAIHGFGLASQHYFRQPVGELGVHQTALLVGLAKGASYYDPWRNPERAHQRRNLVIDLMVEQGVIDEARGRTARRRPLDLAQRRGGTSHSYPAYLELVRRQLDRDYRKEDLRSAGLRIFTHFDPLVQRQVERSTARVLESLEKGYRLPEGQLQTATVMVSAGTADVVALAGGRRSGYAGFNRALEARRQVGSTIKPAVYLAALEQPGRYTLSTPIEDSPLTVEAGNGKVWSPRNYERESHGTVPLYEAFAHSYNQATARLGMSLGLGTVADTLRRLGYEGPLREMPSMLLGATPMTPLEVASLYHTIAADGFYTPLRAIDSVYTADNEPLKRYPFETDQRFSPEVMHLMQYGLQEVVREGTGKAVYRQLPDSLAVAGKTGTTNDQRDSWFAGITGDHVGVVWVGRDDNGEMPLTGATGALQVWSDIMAGLDPEPMAFAKPEGVTYHWVEPATQRLSGEGCEGARYLPYLEGSEPRRKSSCYGAGSRDVIDWFKDKLPW